MIKYVKEIHQNWLSTQAVKRLENLYITLMLYGPEGLPEIQYSWLVWCNSLVTGEATK